MSAAIALLLIAFGALLIWSGVRDKPLMDFFGRASG